MIEASELILNPDGTIYHLRLKPEMVADTIILVGDPGRVDKVSAFFDSVEYKVQNREIKTHTGTYKGSRFSVMSTGMGTDNLDIVINEIDALANIDLENRTVKKSGRTFRLIRLGTSGAMQEDIKVGTYVAAGRGLGIDGLMNFYKVSPEIIDQELGDAFISQTQWPSDLSKPYFIKGSEALLDLFADDFLKGITATAPGFYGPQGRVLRMPLAYPDLNERISAFEFNNQRVINFEMETSGLYGLGRSLGHEVMTVCAVIANRIRKEYIEDYTEVINKLITILLDKLATK
jgi:uridine phosphorylase